MVPQEQVQAILPKDATVGNPFAAEHAAFSHLVEKKGGAESKKRLAHAAAALLYVEKVIKDSALLKVTPEAPSNEPLPLIPPLSPQLRKDLLAYLEAMELLHAAEKKLKEMAKELSHMKNVMYGVVEIMNEFQNIEGAKVSALSSLDDVDSDIREQVTGAEGSVNAIEGGKGTGPHGETPTLHETLEALRLVLYIKQIQAFIDREGGGSKVIGKSTLKNLEDAINNIKKQFGKNWGKPRLMAHDILVWVKEAKKHGGGKFSPQLRNIQFALQHANQTVSALSTATNTQLEFVTNMFKQFLGIDESAMQAYQKGNLNTIQNSKSN